MPSAGRIPQGAGSYPVCRSTLWLWLTDARHSLDRAWERGRSQKHWRKLNLHWSGIRDGPGLFRLRRSGPCTLNPKPSVGLDVMRPNPRRHRSGGRQLSRCRREVSQLGRHSQALRRSAPKQVRVTISRPTVGARLRTLAGSFSARSNPSDMALYNGLRPVRFSHAGSSVVPLISCREIPVCCCLTGASSRTCSPS